MEGTTHIEDFLSVPSYLYEYYSKNIDWDKSMRSRYTSSFGKPYNYSEKEYLGRPFHYGMETMSLFISEKFFKPNNCLLNYYLDGSSKMGYHSDQIDILEKDTGIIIISIGETRELKFRNIINPEIIKTFTLKSGSLFYMNQEVQKEWMHCIPKSDTKNGRISLTFRQIK